MNTIALESATSLPVAERFQLLAGIWASLARDLAAQPASVALLEELDRRDAAYEANPDSGVTLEQMEQQLFPPA